MSEGLDAIDHDHRYVVPIPLKQNRISFNVDLLKRVFALTVGLSNFLFGDVAKVTTGS